MEQSKIIDTTETYHAPSAVTRAMAVEEDVEADAVTTVARARSGATGLMRTAGRTILARAPGGTSLVRIVLRATPVFPHYRRRQEGMTTTIKTRGLGASKSHVLSPASWAELRPGFAAYLQTVCS